MHSKRTLPDPNPQRGRDRRKPHWLEEKKQKGTTEKKDKLFSTTSHTLLPQSVSESCAVRWEMYRSVAEAAFNCGTASSHHGVDSVRGAISRMYDCGAHHCMGCKVEPHRRPRRAGNRRKIPRGAKVKSKMQEWNWSERNNNIYRKLYRYLNLFPLALLVGGGEVRTGGDGSAHMYVCSYKWWNEMAWALGNDVLCDIFVVKCCGENMGTVGNRVEGREIVLLEWFREYRTILSF